MEAALRVPATVLAKVAKVPVRLVLQAPLIKDPSKAARLVDNLESLKAVSKNPAALNKFVQAESKDPRERLKNLINQYSQHRQVMEGTKPLVHVYRLRFSAYDSRARLNAQRAWIAAALMGMKCHGVSHLPTKAKRFTFLKSPFKYKRSQENWEMKIYSHMFAFEAEPEAASKLLNYLKVSSLAGVGIKMTRTAYSPLDSFYVHPYLKPSTSAPPPEQLRQWDVKPEVEKIVQQASQ